MIIDSFRADAARQKSEALRNLATQLIEEHKDYTKKNELDAEYRLEERNKDVEFWKSELGEEVEDTFIESTQNYNFLDNYFSLLFNWKLFAN